MLKQISTIIGRRRSRQMRALLVVMFIGSLLEMLGISLIVSMCSLMLDEGRLMNSRIVSWFCQWSGIRPGRPLMTMMVIGLMGLYLFKMVYLVLEYYALAHFTRVCRCDVSVRLYEDLVTSPYERFAASSTAELNMLVNQDVAQFSSGLSSVLEIGTEGLVVLCVGVFLFFVNPVMTGFAAAGIVVLLVLLQGILKNKTHSAGLRHQKAGKDRMKWIQQCVQGIKDIKTSQTEAFFSEQFRRAESVYSQAEQVNRVWRKMPSLCIETVMVYCILLYIMVLLLSGADMATFFPSLSALALVVVRLLPAFIRISSDLSHLGYARVGLESVDRAMKQVAADREQAGREEERVDLVQSVCVKDVTYSYEGRPEPVLQNVSMEIPIGTSVGIVGPSGAGKTTLVDILLGLLRPGSGAVLADGVDIARCRRSYLEKVAYIPQNIFLMDDTVRANVALGVPPEQVRDEDIWTALEKAALADMVRALPRQLDAQVGEGGIRLSGGERQRLGIARALYRGASFMVFDEATSALDPETENAIIQSVRRLRGETTTVIISHRPSAVQECDKVYRVEGGTVRQLTEEERT